jgi:hypothetical protein
MSGQSVASAAHLPRREGATFPLPAGATEQSSASKAGPPRGSFGAERKSPRGLSPCPTSPGVPDGRTAASPRAGDAGRRVSGAAAAGDGSRTGPVPCGTTCPCGPTDPPPTEGRIPWRAVIPLPGAGVPRVYTGAGGVGRQQLFMQLSKNRSVSYGFNGRGDFTVTAAFSADQGGGHRVSPRFLPNHRLHSASSWGHQGVVKSGPAPGGLPPLPTTGSTPGRAAPAALSGFRTVAGRESA